MNEDHSYVIHQRWLNEKQCIIEFFSVNNGRIQCVTSKSLAPKIGGMYSISWKENKSGLYRLKHADLVGPIHTHEKNHLISLLYIHELMMAVLPIGIAYPKTFEQYGRTLHDLDAKKSIAPILRHFEQVVLEDLGYGINADQLPQSKTGWIQFDIDNGFQLFEQHIDHAYPKEALYRILTQNYQPTDMNYAKSFFQNILRQILPHKIWYSKSIYI